MNLLFPTVIVIGHSWQCPTHVGTKICVQPLLLQNRYGLPYHAFATHNKRIAQPSRWMLEVSNAIPECGIEWYSKFNKTTWTCSCCSRLRFYCRLWSLWLFNKSLLYQISILLTDSLENYYKLAIPARPQRHPRCHQTPSIRTRHRTDTRGGTTSLAARNPFKMK